MNNKLVPYKENIFTKILKFFKRLFFKEKHIKTEQIGYKKDNQSNFKKNIIVAQNEEKSRLKKIQMQYDNGIIDEEEISDEDMDKLIEMYEEETEQLNADTERRKNHISQMLRELKELL